jgi:hypothetical protein
VPNRERHLSVLSDQWSRSKLLIASGLIVLIVGSSFGIYSADRNDREARIGDDSTDYSMEIIRTYGSEEGSIHLRSFLSDPDLSGIEKVVSGNPAKVSLTISDGSSYTQYYPSKAEFDGGGIQVTERRYINIDLGEGSMLPCVMEVTVVEA